MLKNIQKENFSIFILKNVHFDARKDDIFSKFDLTKVWAESGLGGVGGGRLEL